MVEGHTDDADLMSLGDHCEVHDCQQIDFLPFKCDACQKVYCLTHRIYSSHSCQKAGQRETATIICPLCAKAIKLLPEQDANAAFERHTQEACDPTNYSKVHRKPKCPVPNCKERLNSVNTYSCKSCGTSVCLKHRFPNDHDCANRAATAAAQQRPLANKMRNLFGLGTSAPSGAQRPQVHQAKAAQQRGSEASKPAPARPAASAAVRAAAEAAERRRTAPPRAQNSSSTGLERCPQCGETFGTIQELLFHVDAFHPATGSQTAAGATEQCPQCGQHFADAVALVEHVEQQHRSKELCVLC